MPLKVLDVKSVLSIVIELKNTKIPGECANQKIYGKSRQLILLYFKGKFQLQLCEKFQTLKVESHFGGWFSIQLWDFVILEKCYFLNTNKQRINAFAFIVYN